MGYGAAAIGAIPSVINLTYKPMEILHQLYAFNAKTLIVLDALYEGQVAPIREKSPVRTIIATNIVDLVGLSPLKRFLGKLLKKIPTGPVPADALQLNDLLKTEKNVPQVDIDPMEDPATYIMTGGTTGVPKAAVLTHFNVVSNAAQARAWLFKVKAGACSVGVLPLFHSFAMTCVMNISFSYGGWMMLFPKPPPMGELLDTIIKIGPDKATFFCGAEILFKKITDHFESLPEGQRPQINGKLDLCVSGAGPLHRPVQEAFERITGAKLVEGFGLTETSPVVSGGIFWGERRLGVIGYPFPGTDWRILDTETGTKEMGIGPDQAGELIVAGPQVMKGYLNQPEETADHIKELDGKKWMFTGDIGYFDEHGLVTICDRKKQLIKYKGYSVFPKEVEELVGGHEAASEVAVAGIPDPETGEIIKAWVVLRPEFKGKITPAEMVEWCKKNLTHYKQPKLIEFKDDLAQDPRGQDPAPHPPGRGSPLAGAHQGAQGAEEVGLPKLGRETNHDRILQPTRDRRPPTKVVHEHAERVARPTVGGEHVARERRHGCEGSRLRAHETLRRRALHAAGQGAVPARHRQRRQELGTQCRVQVHRAQERGQRPRRHLVRREQARAVAQHQPVRRHAPLGEQLHHRLRALLRRPRRALALRAHDTQRLLRVVVARLLAQLPQPRAQRIGLVLRQRRRTLGRRTADDRCPLDGDSGRAQRLAHHHPRVGEGVVDAAGESHAAETPMRPQTRAISLDSRPGVQAERVVAARRVTPRSSVEEPIRPIPAPARPRGRRPDPYRHRVS